MAKTAFFQKKQFQMQLYGGLTIILMLFLAYYVFTNLTKMLDMRAEINSLNQLHNALISTNARLENEISTVKEENIELTQKIESELELVFPETENHTVLTRTLEQFANDLNRTKNPFIINNLQYLATQKAPDSGYSILPIKMTLHSSTDNFFKFLEYIEKSGTLSDKTRLLDIRSIIINFISPQGSSGNISGKDEINFNVSINAYFRSTL